jgi:hypothetical protein
MSLNQSNNAVISSPAYVLLAKRLYLVEAQLRIMTEALRIDNIDYCVCIPKGNLSDQSCQYCAGFPRCEAAAMVTVQTKMLLEGGDIVDRKHTDQVSTGPAESQKGVQTDRPGS